MKQFEKNIKTAKFTRTSTERRSIAISDLKTGPLNLYSLPGSGTFCEVSRNNNGNGALVVGCTAAGNQAAQLGTSTSVPLQCAQNKSRKTAQRLYFYVGLLNASQDEEYEFYVWCE
ncbi:hypothetical protein WDW37_06630 [Bdellovibrionota bacterium FG-1]